MAFDLETSKYLLELIRCALNDTLPQEKPDDISWHELYTMAKRHSVTALAYYSLKRSGQCLDPAVQVQWQESYNKALVKSGNQEYELATLCDAFSETGISHMPLKGSCIRDLFPMPYLREMSDLDILVPPEQIDAATEIILNHGYIKGIDNGAHVDFKKPPYMCIELHKELVPPTRDYYYLVKEPWSFAKKTDTPHRFEMSAEDFYFYLILHTAKHYYECGTGIRYVIDVYLYLRSYGKCLNQEYVEKKFEDPKLQTFRKEIEALADQWFLDGNIGKGEVESYILRSATYGTTDGRAANLVRKKMEEGKNLRCAKLSYYFSMVFLPLREMYVAYPVLKKAPILLPFCWVARWLKILFTKPQNIFKRYRESMQIQVYDDNQK